MFSDMIHRERFLAAIDHKPTDRVPTFYWGEPLMNQKMFQYLNIPQGDWVAFAHALDIDTAMRVEPICLDDRPNEWNVPTKKISTQDDSVYYMEPAYFPLGDCETIDEIEACYTFPTTDLFDYSTIACQCEEYAGFAITGGWIAPDYAYQMLRGTEQMLVDFIENPELADYLMGRCSDFYYEHTKKILEAAQGKIDYVQCDFDMGCQHGLLMSPEMIDRFMGKHLQRGFDLYREYDARVFHHDDGAMTEMIPWLMDKGIQVLNPLQWHLPGWDLRELKQKYGDRLCFHGGVDNQYVLPFGTKQEIWDEVYACCDQLYSDRTGYILGPCHNIQANTPVESVLEMYNAAKAYTG